MEAKLDSLHLDSPKRNSSSGVGRALAETGVADSWEDEADGNAHAPTVLNLRRVDSDDGGTHPPPPTPIPPEAGSKYDWPPAGVLGGGRPQPVGPGPSMPRAEGDSERRRPEKTTAAAGRMIAASLGMKAPKKTEEQRQYDRAVREQEIKRKNREKEDLEREREEDEKAKAAVWDG
ncbi:hypothetical protein DV736_g322, partial [Chaetothyriales sp. CBS 134916]